MLWLRTVCLALPFVAALTRYAVDYGYRGFAAKIARSNAVRMFWLFTAFSVIYYVVFGVL